MFQGQLSPGRAGFGGGNFVLLTGSDGVILIDDAIESMAGNVIKAVEAHTSQPVDFLINTHVHGDHIGGNAALHETGATIITHDNIRQRMLANKAAMRIASLGLPVKEMIGGIEGWKDEGFELVSK